MNKLFSIILLILSCALSLSKAYAQTTPDGYYSITAVLDSTPGVIINQPETLTKRLVKDPGANIDNTNLKGESSVRKDNKTAVYRIEVFSDNSPQAKTQATTRRRNVQNRFPQYPSNLVFESPFWRVKVGVFTSRSDAEAAMAEIRNAFPAYGPYLRIVSN